jgi:hypothetical protein
LASLKVVPKCTCSTAEEPHSITNSVVASNQAATCSSVTHILHNCVLQD